MTEQRTIWDVDEAPWEGREEGEPRPGSVADLLGKWHRLREAFKDAEEDEQDAIRERAVVLAMETDGKLDRMAGADRRILATADFLKDEAKRIGARAKSRAGESERIRDRMAVLMQAMERGSVKTEHNTLTLQPGRESLVIDEAELPLAFKVPGKMTKDTDKIKAALKRGEAIPGARYDTGRPFVQIR